MSGNWPAFPGDPNKGEHPGMSFREWLIGQRLNGWRANDDLSDPLCAYEVADLAIADADAIIAALKEEE